MTKGALEWLCAVLAGGALAQAAAENAPAPADPLSRWEPSPPMQQAIAAARRYWSTTEPDYTEDVRVLATTTGAFTRPGLEQRAILYRMSLAPRGFPKKGLAVIEGDRLVRNVAFVLLADDVATLADFDGDGRDALALEGGFAMGGQESRGVTIAAFGERGLTQLGDVSTYESTCGTGLPDAPGPTSARISVVAGSGLMIQRFARSSCEAEKWEPLGEPEPLALETPAKDPFQELPPQ